VLQGVGSLVPEVGAHRYTSAVAAVLVLVIVLVLANSCCWGGREMTLSAMDSLSGC